LFLQYFK